MIDEKEMPVLDTLQNMGIPFERFEHQAAMTMQDCELFDTESSAEHCKNLFLRNRQGTEFYLLLVAGDKPFHTKELSAQLGISRLSFAGAEQLAEHMGLTPGAVTPLGLINDHTHIVRVLVDKEILRWEDIIVHPNVNTASIMLKTRDLLKFFFNLKYSITEVTLSGEA